MKTTLSKPAPTKVARKTPTRRTQPAAVETTETAVPASPTAATPNTTATVTNEVPPSDTIPALNTPFGSGVTIVFADLNEKKVLSDHAGAFTLAKRCAMAYAVATKTGNNYRGIACGDLTSAFKVTHFNQVKNSVTVQVVPGTPTVELNAGGDVEYDNSRKQQVRSVPAQYARSNPFPFHLAGHSDWS